MTRFARAKGSKSSNEKLPEEGTPWSEMKKSLLMKQEKGNQETFISKNKNSTQQVKPLEWCSLDEEGEDCLNLLKTHLKKNKSQNKLEDSVDSGKKRKRNENCPEAEVGPTPQKKNKKLKNFTNTTGGISSLEIKSKETEKNDTVDGIEKECINSSKLKKKKKKNNKLIKSSVSEGDVVMKKKKKKVKTSESESMMKDEKNEEESVDTTGEMKEVKTSKKKKTFDSGKKKSKKFVKKTNQSGQVEKKFKFDGNKFTTKINIGGEMVSLIKYQGFYVTKDDAKRLKEMKRKMQEEGLPESEIESVIKLERRKCEKSLARMKKNVCFQCRKPGHILSQCPEMQDKMETGTGICYKCGSTEHKAFTCKVMHKQKFPFAECFICKEKGHIARECPDNPRGLYPNGGCCKLCGDVTHLKKDCPTKILESEEKTLKVGIRDDRNVEGLEEVSEKHETNNRKKQKKKLVTY